MKIQVASGVVTIEDTQFDYSNLKGSGSRLSADLELDFVAIKKLCDEIALRIFTLQEVLG